MLMSLMLISPAMAQMSGEIYFEIEYEEDDDDDDDGPSVIITGELVNTGNVDIDIDIDLGVFVSQSFPNPPFAPDLNYILELEDDPLEPGEDTDFEIELFVNNPAHKLMVGTNNIITIWPLNATDIITIWPLTGSMLGFGGSNDYGSASIFVPESTTTTNILNFGELDRVTTFPSPSTGVFNIDLTNAELTGDFTLEVYNAQGKNVMTELRQINNSIMQFNLSHVAPDLYFISIKDSNGILKYQSNLIITQ